MNFAPIRQIFSEVVMSTKIPQASRDYENTHIIERPDGFYWHYENASEKVFGPFTTLLDAVHDMEYTAESDYELGETLEQAEDKIGMSGWIDPATGEPGEESFRLEN